MVAATIQSSLSPPARKIFDAQILSIIQSFPVQKAHNHDKYAKGVVAEEDFCIVVCLLSYYVITALSGFSLFKLICRHGGAS